MSGQKHMANPVQSGSALQQKTLKPSESRVVLAIGKKFITQKHQSDVRQEIYLTTD